MDTFEILAIIGALAWTYPLYKTIKEQLTKPVLAATVHTELQIGYQISGQYLSMEVAIAAFKKDGLISKVELILEHEQKEVRTLTWNYFEEKLLEMEVSGEKIPYKRTQKAIALQVLTSVLNEKTIVFTDFEFQENASNLENAVTEKLNNLRQSGGDIETIRSTNQYNDLVNIYRERFPWKVGRYNCVLRLHSPNANKVFETPFYFDISRSDFNKLEENLGNCQIELDSALLYGQTETELPWTAATVYAHNIEK